jgi:hypothetical protein
MRWPRCVDDKLVAHQRRHLQSKASGVKVEYDQCLVLAFREGEAIRDEWFADRETASSDTSAGTSRWERAFWASIVSTDPVVGVVEHE